MCCIFTCCGWVIDLFQRFWTFTMSCCISSAVCCSFLTACISGIALGYNYSLAEYIDLKETNVTVYLKRGIFDDEIEDDMVWRRSGHMPIDGYIKEDKLITGESDETTSIRSGRRLDDSIYESNDKHNFEGSLMKLTAKPLDQVNLPTATRTTAMDVDEIVKPFEKGSLDELKAIQSAINMQKAAAVAAGRRTTKKSEEAIINSRRRFENLMPAHGRQLNYDIPPFEEPRPNSPPFNMNPLRQAVPDDQINQSYKWRLAKLPPQEVPKHIRFDERYKDLQNVPPPVTPRAGPARPTKPKLTSTTRSYTPTRSPDPNLPMSLDEEMESFKEKPLLDRFDDLGIKDDFLRKIKITDKKTDEEYEDEIKGVPLRKKRNNILIASSSPHANQTIEGNDLNRSTKQSKNMNILSNTVSVNNVSDTKNIYLRKKVEVPLSNKISRNVSKLSESLIIRLLFAESVA